MGEGKPTFLQMGQDGLFHTLPAPIEITDEMVEAGVRAFHDHWWPGSPEKDTIRAILTAALGRR